MTARRISAITFALVSLLFAQTRIATAQGDDLKVGGAWVSLPLLRDEPAQAYFTLQNWGKRARKIVGAKSPRAERAEIHRTVFKDGKETTEQVKEWEVPKDGTVVFAPGGMLVALHGPKDLKEGEKIQIELEFADGAKLRVEAVVKDE
jgi:hypothetical protein